MDGRRAPQSEIDRSRTVLALPGIIAGARQQGIPLPHLGTSCPPFNLLGMWHIATGYGFLSFTIC